MLAGDRPPGGDLVEQRLEQVEVAAVDEGDVNVCPLQGLRGGQPAEPAADDHDLVPLGHGGHLQGKCRVVVVGS